MTVSHERRYTQVSRAALEHHRTSNFSWSNSASDPKSAAHFFLSGFQKYLTLYIQFSNRQLLRLLNTACVCLCHEYIQMKGRIDLVAVLLLFSPCEGGKKSLHFTYWASLKKKLGVQPSVVAKCRRNPARVETSVKGRQQTGGVAVTLCSPLLCGLARSLQGNNLHRVNSILFYFVKSSREIVIIDTLSLKKQKTNSAWWEAKIPITFTLIIVCCRALSVIFVHNYCTISASK